MSLLDNFPHRCTIRRKTRTKGSLGSSKDSFANEQTNVFCWEQQASAVEVANFEKRGMRISRKIFFLTDPAVTERHQILITERNGIAESNPVALDVKTQPMPDASAGAGVVWKVMADKLTGEDD